MLGVGSGAAGLAVREPGRAEVSAGPRSLGASPARRDTRGSDPRSGDDWRREPGWWAAVAVAEPGEASLRRSPRGPRPGVGGARQS